MELTHEAIDEIERRLENPTAGATYETPELRVAPRRNQGGAAVEAAAKGVER